MNRALWKKNFVESRWLLAGCAVLMFGFQWLRVWLIGQLPLGKFKVILSLLPSHWEKLSPVPFEQIATPAGRIAVAYDEPLVLLLITVWAIARGSDAVSGEIGRGTMEMLLAQPVRRVSVLATQALVTIGGAVVIAAAGWSGTWMGLATVQLEESAAAHLFVPCAINLFALTFFVAGLTTLASSCDRYRWRTIGLIGAFYAVEMIVKVIGRLAPGWDWLVYLSFFTPFEPQPLVADPRRSWSFGFVDGGEWVLGALGYDAILIGLGGLCYLAAAVIFSRRDLPAPL